jgi:Do/DeqQ family serine protease
MKQFGSLFLAAVVGSICTLASYQFLNDNQNNVKLEYSIPTANVAYKNAAGDPIGVGPDFTVTAEKVTPAVVYIRSTQQGGHESEVPQNADPFREFFGPRMQQGPSQSSGSGVIINENGYIVTNNHVVKDADIVEVTLYDNRTMKAEVIGIDADTDLALIKINATDLPHLPFVDSDQAKVGQWVLAVGNPFNLNSTVTAGIISAKGRNINILNGNTQKGNTAIESFIQTDAAINPGNSGGALVDLGGGLVGINTAIASPTGSYSGYGFAVPSNLVSKIVEDLIKFGTVQRGWLGVSITSVTSELVREHDLRLNDGAYVSGFADNSSAKEAGIKEGDVIVKINEATIRTSSALIENIGRHRPGDKLTIVVNRNGKELSYPVILKNREGNTGNVKPEERNSFTALGMEVDALDAKVLKKLDLQNGVIVKSLSNGKITKLTDMREGFIITKVNDVAIKSVKDFTELLKGKKAGELVIFSGTYEDFPREFNYALRW